MAEQRPVRRAFTGRALVLGALVIALIIVLASPLHRYFASRGAAADAASKLRADKVAVSTLQRQLAQWSDPGFVAAQARSQLQYVMPGDTVYVVVNNGAASDIEKTRRTASGAASGSQAWNGKLWSSVVKAAQ